MLAESRLRALLGDVRAPSFALSYRTRLQLPCTNLRVHPHASARFCISLSTTSTPPSSSISASPASRRSTLMASTASSTREWTSTGVKK